MSSSLFCPLLFQNVLHIKNKGNTWHLTSSPAAHTREARPIQTAQQKQISNNYVKVTLLTYPRPFPDHTADPVSLVKQWVICGGEAGILKEEAALQALPLQGGVMLPLEGLHRGEHAAALKKRKHQRQLSVWVNRYISEHTPEGR